VLRSHPLLLLNIASIISLRTTVATVAAHLLRTVRYYPTMKNNHRIRIILAGAVVVVLALALLGTIAAANPTPVATDEEKHDHHLRNLLDGGDDDSKNETNAEGSSFFAALSQWMLDVNHFANAKNNGASNETRLGDDDDDVDAEGDLFFEPICYVISPLVLGLINFTTNLVPLNGDFGPLFYVTIIFGILVNILFTPISLPFSLLCPFPA